ncbi:MAG: APC family permease [Candidatus Korobacteraceae bacterium]
MGVVDLLFGRPLASSEDQGERITPSQGVPTFGLDALSSAAYGPEAALTILLPLGLAGVHYVAPLTAAIVILLMVVFFSYRQTIAAYPSGGGSYTVAKENLGPGAGLLAAAALMIDYLLNVAVGISAGIGALVSAVPWLQRYTLPMCLAVLAILTVVNLRGVREAGSAFIAPTYLFVGTLGLVIAIGIFKVIMTGGHPHALVLPPHAPVAAAGTVGLWLLLRAFASGCTALTGVEAVSNGVQAFREPVVPAARKTLTIIVLTLVFLLGGIATLVYFYGVAATDPGQPGYQSVLSLVAAAVAGRGALYGLTMFSVLLVLCLSANTSFADFPRLCRAVALDDYLPHSLTVRGRRLVYSQGIGVLALLAAVLLIIFGGITDRLIPLFAVGAFLAFTLSQAGMVVHWRKNNGSFHHLLINGIGAAATGVTVVVVVAAKFTQGAWIVVLLLPAAILLMARVRRHYRLVTRETEAKGSLLRDNNQHPPIVIVPIDQWNAAAQKTLRFAMTLSPDVHAVHVACGEDDSIAAQWQSTVEQPALEAGAPVPLLITLNSPYRLVLQPVVDYVLQVEKENRHRTVAVAISTMVERHWYHYFLHNQRSEVLTAMLLLGGDRRINIINVPWYLRA